MILPKEPPDWGTDKITDYFDNVRLNVFASYDNFKRPFNQLSQVDNIFRDLTNNLNNTKDLFSALFVYRSHSAFLTGCHLSMAGQAPEAYALLRLCIEYALYGLHVYKYPKSVDIWLKRHDDLKAKSRVQSEFSIKKLFETLTACNKKEAIIAKGLYDWCIDFGGHPNESAITQSLNIDNNDKYIKYSIVYLSGDKLLLRSCLKTTAQVGASVLGVFRIIYKERFDLIGLTDKLERARRGL